MITRRNQSRTVLDRRQKASTGLLWAAGLTIGALLAFQFWFDERGLPTYLEMLKRKDSLADEIKALEQTNLDLRTDIARVQKDPARIEELARERLGYVRKGETVYQIVEDRPASESQ